MKLSLARITPIISKALGVTPDQLTKGFRPASEQDIEDVIEFRKNNFNDNHGWDDQAYLRWRFDFYSKQNDCSNIFWILKINDEILGTIGLECFDLMVDGKTIVARHPSDLLVKSSVNGLGVGAWINLMIEDKFPVLVAVGSTEQSLSLIKKQYHPLSNCQSWKLPISVKGTLWRITNNALIASAGSLLFDWVLKINRYIKFRKYNQKSLHVNKITRFDSVIDEWSASFNKALVYRRRDSEYLNWRFLDNPRQNYQALGVYYKDTLMGYSIFHCHRSLQNKQLEAYIDDVFWYTTSGIQIAESKIFSYLLVLTINELISSGAKLVDISIYSNDLTQQLIELGFKIRGDRDIFAVSSNHGQNDSVLFDKRNWFLTAADMHGDSL